MTQNKLTQASLLGLGGSLFLSVAGLGLNQLGVRSWLGSYGELFLHPLVIWLTFFIISGISLVEIPMMIYTIRTMAASNKPNTARLVILTTGLYVLFAAFYALPFLLLAEGGYLAMGFFLASMSFLRFGVGLVFLKDISL